MRNQSQGDTGKGTDRPGLFFSPILRRKRDDRDRDRDAELLDHIKDHVHGSSSGKGGLAVAAEHDIVRHVDGIADDILKDDKAKESEQRLIKGPVFGEK